MQSAPVAPEGHAHQGEHSSWTHRAPRDRAELRGWQARKTQPTAATTICCKVTSTMRPARVVSNDNRDVRLGSAPEQGEKLTRAFHATAGLAFARSAAGEYERHAVRTQDWKRCLRPPIRAAMRSRSLVGAAYDGIDDQTERFVAEGIWGNGTGTSITSSFAPCVQATTLRSRRPTRASTVCPSTMPATLCRSSVSRVTGTIRENLGDGRVVRVAWAPIEPIRGWYFFPTERRCGALSREIGGPMR